MNFHDTLHGMNRDQKTTMCAYLFLAHDMFACILHSFKCVHQEPKHFLYEYWTFNKFIVIITPDKMKAIMKRLVQK